MGSDGQDRRYEEPAGPGDRFLTTGGPTNQVAEDFDIQLQQAALGDPGANHTVGMAFAMGTGGVARDARRAMRHLTEASKARHLPSYLPLALLHFSGAVAEALLDEGWRVLRQGAALGDAKCQGVAAERLIDAWIAAPDEERARLADEAFRWASAAAAKEDTAGLKALAQCRADGIGCPRDRSAAELVLARLEPHDPAATRQLREEWGLEAARPAAAGSGSEAEFAQRLAAAGRGDVEAQYVVAGMFELGIGTRPSYEQAAAWYRQAASRGHIGAKTRLAHLTGSGMGVEADAESAIALYRSAAEAGDPEALFNWARILEGLAQRAGNQAEATRHREEAISCYAKAAAAGNAEAARRLLLLAGQAQSPSPSASSDLALRAPKAAPPPPLPEDPEPITLEAESTEKIAGLEDLLQPRGEEERGADPEQLFFEGMVQLNRTHYTGAIDKFAKAAAAGHGDAAYRLAVIYETGGMGAPRDPERAAKLYRMALDKRVPAACLPLAMLVARKEVTILSGEDAVSILRRGAAMGDTNAEAELAQRLRHLAEETRDRKQRADLASECMKLARSAAGKDHAEALVLLADCYVDGFGCAADVDAAETCLTKAIKLGHPTAELLLRDLRKVDSARYTDPKTQFEIAFEKASRGGAEDQFNLALLFEEGTGTGKSPAKAADWYRRAARQGHKDAKINLASLLASGPPGLEKNLAEAESLYAEAAAEGDAFSMYRLGQICESVRKMKFLKPRMDEAVAWYEKAAAKGYKPAAERLKLLQK
jgi:TPR repeat protein